MLRLKLCQRLQVYLAVFHENKFPISDFCSIKVRSNNRLWLLQRVTRIDTYNSPDTSFGQIIFISGMVWFIHQITRRMLCCVCSSDNARVIEATRGTSWIRHSIQVYLIEFLLLLLLNFVGKRSTNMVWKGQEFRSERWHVFGNDCVFVLHGSFSRDFVLHEQV